MATLKLRTTGLWVYVPKNRITQEADNEILMLAVENPRGDGFHEPVLIVEKTSEASSSWDDRNEEGDLYLYPLENRHVEIAGAASDALELVSGSVPEDAECPANPGQEPDTHWLPHMQRYHPQASLHTDALEHPEESTTVLARVRLSQGLFRTHFIFRDCNGDVIRWRTQGRSQAFADEMELVATVGNEVTIQAFDKDGNEVDWVTLQARNDEIVAYLKSLPVDSPRLLLKPRYKTKDGGIPHFPRLRRVFQGNPSLRAPDPDPNCARIPEPEPFDECLRVEASVSEEEVSPQRRRRLNDPQCPGILSEPLNPG